MSKQLYEEALADVKKVKEVAEANAQRVILDAVVPRIRDLIERELLNEHGLDDEEFGDPGSLPPEGELMTDLSVASSDDSSVADAITPPDEEGKVTLDLDALHTDPAGVAVTPPTVGPLGDEYEMSLESIDALTPVFEASKFSAQKEFELSINRMGEDVGKFSKAGRLVKESVGFHKKIAQMISNVEDMYDYVQESIVDPAKKSSYETKLETYFKELNKLQESMMSQKKKKMMNEEDVTLKLTGLPDDIDLDSVGVDLITGEEDGEGEDLDLDMGDESGEGEEDGGDADLDMGDVGEDDVDMGEAQSLSDDTVVEIDEGMLRREIARMRKLREEAVPSNAGAGVDADAMDDFGGGSSEGEPLDVDMPDQSDSPGALPLGEADEDLDEMDQLDELDGTDEVTAVESAACESLQRRSAFETRLQNRARARATGLKREAVRARGSKLEALKKEYAQVTRRFNESVARSKKLTKRLAEAKSVQNGTRQNTGSSRSAEARTVNSLRSKLAETNLINAKLMLTNKLLQNESLTTRQKAAVIGQLDAAKTMSEARLVYESLSKALGRAKRPVNESADRKVLGSSSRVTRSASSQTLNEGFETDRWARIAGITK